MSKMNNCIKMLKLYCCSCCFSLENGNGNIEPTSPPPPHPPVPPTNVNVILDTILVLDNKKDLSENILDEEFISIDKTYVEEREGEKTEKSEKPFDDDNIAEESITKIENNIIDGKNDNYF